MLDLADRDRFVEEALHVLRVGGHLRLQDLDRDAGLKVLVLGEPHLAHATTAELANDTEVTDRLANHLPSTIHRPRPARESRLQPTAACGQSSGRNTSGYVVAIGAAYATCGSVAWRISSAAQRATAPSPCALAAGIESTDWTWPPLIRIFMITCPAVSGSCASTCS